MICICYAQCNPFLFISDMIKPWWVWGFWVSPLSYGQQAISVNEFTATRWTMACSLDYCRRIILHEKMLNIFSKYEDISLMVYPDFAEINFWKHSSWYCYSPASRLTQQQSLVLARSWCDICICFPFQRYSDSCSSLPQP